MDQSNCNRQTNNCPIGNSVVVDSIMVQSEYQTRGGIESAMPLRDRGGREIEWHRPERIHHHPRYLHLIILFRDSVAHKAHPESTAISVNLQTTTIHQQIPIRSEVQQIYDKSLIKFTLYYPPFHFLNDRVQLILNLATTK